MFCATRIVYGGVVRPKTLRTAPDRRMVMGIGLNKSMETASNSSLTDKQVRVTIGSLTTRKKKFKKIAFFYLIISDPIVMRKCLSVRDDFLIFPSIFFEAYHHHYTPIRCCAQRFGPRLPPHILFGWRKNRKMAKPYTSARNAFFMERVRKSWAQVQARASISCFFK